MSSPTRNETVARREGMDAALRRAALRARELAEQTQTPCYVLRDGRIVDLRKENPKDS